jgi:hypothetical protein
MRPRATRIKRRLFHRLRQIGMRTISVRAWLGVRNYVTINERR